MRKLLLVSVFALLTFSSCICAKYVEAEDQNDLRWNAGDINLGGKFAYSSSSQGDSKDSELKLRPSVGFLLSDKVELAGSLGFNSGKTENGSFEDKWNSISVGPSIRYFPCNDWRLLPYVEGGVNYESYTYDTADYKQTGFGVNAGLGVDYFVTKNIALTAGWTAASYQSLSDDRDGVDDINTFNISANTNRFRLGFVWRF